jgi:L-alanine-DL-glutamate epimerase-like enolase superfamily enzyme
VKIVDVSTTQLFVPDVPGIVDATIRHQAMGRGALFVHLKTDEGLEGLGICTAVGARAILEGDLKEILIGQDPLAHEKLWDDMFWRVRGTGGRVLRSVPSRRWTSRSGI